LSREKAELVLSKEKNSNFDAGQAASMAIFRGMAKLSSGLLEIEMEEVRRGDSRFIIEGRFGKRQPLEFVRGTDRTIKGI